MFPVSFKSLSDKERHDYILKTFILNRSASLESRHYKRDIDIIREHHRFLWDESNDDKGAADETWEARLARRYYDKLFKEYCIADLTRHRENKVALRWRIEAEVVSGKGQFQCGSRKCEQRDDLRSWEVNFAYQEKGEGKNALVKLRLCPEHSGQLNHTSRKREVKRLKRNDRRQTKRDKKTERKRQRKSTKTKESKESNEESTAHYDLVEMDSSSDDSGDETVSEATDQPGTSAETASQLKANDDVWSKKVEVEAEPSREADFERYLEDLLL